LNASHSLHPSVVVSLDFELRWGAYDVCGEDVTKYRANLEGVTEVVPRLLEVFSASEVRAMWATVGAVACDGWDEWRARAPHPPRYDDPALSWRDAYRAIDPTGRLHFAPKLVDAIAKSPGQELASHTFGHVYLREPGLTREDAVADTDAMTKLFEERWRLVPRSIVFPRNR
jgi:peptidoglycan/xylan/chitin deacetylase (PgdA/CDA1 family)